MQVHPEHPNAAKASSLSRMLCLYDNAGEHFQPGQDTASSPVTRHLALSRAILFLFDPTQDQRFRAACLGGGAGAEKRLSRQEVILNEAAARVRRHAGLPQGAKHDRPLIVVLSKYDRWSHLFTAVNAGEPWRTSSSGGIGALDVESIEQQSANLRRLLLHYCPETVAAAEGFSREVVYIPISSLGEKIEADPGSGVASIRPEDVRPHWVTTPLLYSISRSIPGLIPKLVRRPKKAAL